MRYNLSFKSSFFLRSIEVLIRVHSRIQNKHDVCPIHKWAIFVLIKAAQGFSVRRTSVRRSRKPAENAEQGKKGHLWMDTNLYYRQISRKLKTLYRHLWKLHRQLNASIGFKPSLKMRVCSGVILVTYRQHWFKIISQFRLHLYHSMFTNEPN